MSYQLSHSALCYGIGYVVTALVYILDNLKN